MVQLLLELGADVNAVDGLDETPLDLLSYLGGDVATDPLVQNLRSAGGRWVRYAHRHQDQAAPAPVAEQTIAGAHVNRRKQSRPATPTLTTKGLGPIKLGRDPITIGRSAECDVHYRSLTLSRRHARIEPQGDGYVVTDLGSHNGTQVDGEKITAPYLLEPDEIITVGAYEFGFDGSRLIPTHGELSHDELAKERRRE
jgi:pSer/pThr/pTyr-binding forkhead associated (FHA) protein